MALNNARGSPGAREPANCAHYLVRRTRADPRLIGQPASPSTRRSGRPSCWAARGWAGRVKLPPSFTTTGPIYFHFISPIRTHTGSRRAASRQAGPPGARPPQRGSARLGSHAAWQTNRVEPIACINGDSTRLGAPLEGTRPDWPARSSRSAASAARAARARLEHHLRGGKRVESRERQHEGAACRPAPPTAKVHFRLARLISDSVGGTRGSDGHTSADRPPGT